MKTPTLLPVLAVLLLAVPSCNSNPGPDSISSHGAARPGVLPPDCGLCHGIAMGTRRAVMGANGDFGSNPTRTSHHVTGAADPTPAQCLICHNIDLHGSGTVRLNHADTGAVIPYASPSNMEAFCLSCHDALGANGNMSPLADGAVLGALYEPKVVGYPTVNQPVTAGWTAPGDAYADDGVYATASPAQNATVDSRWGGFGFDDLLPAPPYTTRIDAVRIIAEYHVSTTASIASLAAQATVAGVDCPAGALIHSAEPLTDTVVTFDVTGCRAWTRDDLLDANFQVRIGARRGNSATAVNFFLDNVRAEVTYNRTGYKAGSKIETNWNKNYGHRYKDNGLTCLGNGSPNTGCHLNGHGSVNKGMLALNMTFPLPDRFEENDFQLCFSCHTSYATTVSKEVVFGVKLGGNYDVPYGPYRLAGPATITFDNAANTITRDTGSFISDRFLIGNEVEIFAAADPANRGPFLIADVTDGALTVTTPAGGDPALVDGTETSLTVSTASPLYYIPAIQTRFRDQICVVIDQPYKDNNCGWWGFAKANLHWLHIAMDAWSYRDSIASGMSCTACHSVHGTNSLWGMTHDELGYQHHLGAGSDEYGTMSSQLPYTADQFPVNCTFLCHDGNWWGTTSNWFEPSNE